MAQKYAYQVGNDVVTDLPELAGILHVPKVTLKDIQEGGRFHNQVVLIDLDEYRDPAVKTKVFNAVSPEEVTVTPEDIKATLPDFETLDELKEFIKDLDTPTLEYLARGLKLSWTPTYHESIHRMRVAMALHRYFFPELFKPKDSDKKRKSKYGDYSTEDLIKLANHHNVHIDMSGNEPIDRMRIIIALRKAGHLPDNN